MSLAKKTKSRKSKSRKKTKSLSLVRIPFPKAVLTTLEHTLILAVRQRKKAISVSSPGTTSMLRFSNFSTLTKVE